MREPPEVPPTTSIEEARAARATSEAGLRHAQARDPSVREVGASLRGHRRTNHFAELMASTFREPRT